MLPELPPLGPHDHPDPHAMVWSELELRAIRAYATAYATACVMAERESMRSALMTARAYIARYGYTGDLLEIIDAALHPVPPDTIGPAPLAT